MLRTDADDCEGVCEGVILLIAHMHEKHSLYRRVAGATELLAFCAWRFFSCAFFAFARCLCHATRFVLFIRHSLSICYSVLFFKISAVFEVNFRHVVAFFAAIIVFVIIAYLFILITIITQH
jgi:hypothetical protein